MRPGLRGLRSLAASAALGAALAGPTAAAAEVRILVSAGSDAGLPDEVPLRWAVRDAERVSELMQRLGGVDPGATLLLRAPDAATLEQALDRARTLAAAHPREAVSFFFYFSGHGDEGSLHLDGARLPLERVQALVDAVPARLRLVLVDACRTSARDKGLTKGESFEVDVRRAPGAAGSVRIWSSVAGESAQESDTLGGAVFTHYWLSGLAGAADANGDAEVTFSEAYDHAAERTLSRSALATGIVQRPAYEAQVEAERALVLTRLQGAEASLVLPADPGARYLVYRLPAASLLAEATGRAKPQRLAIPAGRLLVQRRTPSESAAATFLVASGEARAFALEELEPHALTELVEKGGTLETDPWRIWAGGGAALGSRGEWGPSVSVGARRRFGGVEPGVRLAVSGTERRADGREIEETALLGAAEIGPVWSPEWSDDVLRLGVAAGPAARWLRQTRYEASGRALELTGRGGTSTHDAFGFGGAASALAEARLSESFLLGLGVGLQALGLRESGEIAFRIDGLAEIRLGLVF